MDNQRPTLTVNVSNIPPTVVETELLSFLESRVGNGVVFAAEIFTEHKNWKSRGHGRVQFENPVAKAEALSLSDERKLLFKGFHLSVSHSFVDVIGRPVEQRNRIGDGGGFVLTAGIMVSDDRLGVLKSWEGVKLWIMPERSKLEYFVDFQGKGYKFEVQFVDVLETRVCCLDRNDVRADAILLKLSHAPKIFKRSLDQSFCRNLLMIDITSARKTLTFNGFAQLTSQV